jgi:hypothetical protein
VIAFLRGCGARNRDRAAIVGISETVCAAQAQRRRVVIEARTAIADAGLRLRRRRLVAADPPSRRARREPRHRRMNYAATVMGGAGRPALQSYAAIAAGVANVLVVLGWNGTRTSAPASSARSWARTR